MECSKEESFAQNQELVGNGYLDQYPVSLQIQQKNRRGLGKYESIS